MYCQLCLDQSGNHFVNDGPERNEKNVLLELIFQFLKLEHIQINKISAVLCPECDEILEGFYKFCQQIKKQHRLKAKDASNTILNDIEIKPEKMSDEDLETTMDCNFSDENATMVEEKTFLQFYTEDTNTTFVKDESIQGSSSDRASKLTGATSEELEGVNKVLFSEKFFKILEKINSTSFKKRSCGIVAICQVCGHKIKGSLGVSSNFINHLRKHHPKKYDEFQSEKAGKRQKTDLRSSLNRDLLNFVRETFSPFSVIDNPSFKQLLPGRNIPSGREIARLLYESHMESIAYLSMELDKVEYICTTADVWSHGKKSFFGYTCHWLNANTFKRNSAALACRRFKGTHSFDRVTKTICDINREYHIPVEKIVYIVTDNGSNFIKAFKEFGVSLSYAYGNNSENNDENSDDESEFSGPAFHSMAPQLPKHFSCASHTLNLLATTDFMRIINSSCEMVQNIHKASFNRCTQIWNKCKRPKSAEVVDSVLHAQLTTPCATRWKSLYDSVEKLLQYKSSLDELCFRLRIPTILSDEIEYLEEYVKVMQPIANAIDFLQDEKHMLFGYFVPTIVSIKVKMRQLASQDLKYLKDVNENLQEALVKRFEKYFYLMPDSWDAVVAAIAIPEVKLRFLKALLQTAVSHTEEEVKQIFNKYVLEFGKIPKRETRQMPTSQPPATFLDFGDESSDTSVQGVPFGVENYVKETLLYLIDSDMNISSLDRHPHIKNVSLKYNTPLPSSAPVERLFSFADIVNRSRRQKLSDSNFEMLVLRKANKL